MSEVEQSNPVDSLEESTVNLKKHTAFRDLVEPWKSLIKHSETVKDVMVFN